MLKVYHSLESFQSPKRKVLTIGTFDGVHLGHQKIIEKLVLMAKTDQGESVVLTFFPHPRMVLYPDDHGIRLLNTLEEKIALLEKTGIDHLIIEPFTKEFSRLSAEQYMQQIIVDKIGAEKIVIGYDHRFGKNREGDLNVLEKFAQINQIELEEIPREDIDQIGISSTKIRNYLNQGMPENAERLLGKRFSFEGKVMPGNQLGRQIGFPTANLGEIPDYKLIPSDGVYAVYILINEARFIGMMNIGNRPTVDGFHHAIEVNIFDFAQDIYHQKVRVEIVSKIRDEQKFPNIEALKNQLSIDKVRALALLS